MEISASKVSIIYVSLDPELLNLSCLTETSTEGAGCLSWGEVKSMAVQLEMEYFRLQQIEERNTKVSDCLLPALDMWLNSDDNATWTKIIKALR